MFRFFVNPLGAQAGVQVTMRDLSDLHPTFLEALLERSWNFRVNVPANVLGHPDHRSDIPGRPDQFLNPVLTGLVPLPPRLIPVAPGAPVGGINIPALDAAIQAFL